MIWLDIGRTPPISASLLLNSMVLNRMAKVGSPSDQKHLATFLMSDTTSPRFGPGREPIDALLAGVKIFECGALSVARRENARIRMTASVSLPRRRPGDNQFCNNKFV